MYTGLLHLHSGLRWLLVLILLFVLIKFTIALARQKPWAKTDHIINTALLVLMDLQLLSGLVLYFFVSPITKAAMQNFGAAMKNADLRFYAVEHFFIMLIAIIVVHIGHNKIKRTGIDRKKFTTALIFTGIATVLIVAGIPWSRL